MASSKLRLLLLVVVGLPLVAGSAMGLRSFLAKRQEVGLLEAAEAKKPAALLELRAAEDSRLTGIEDAMNTLATKGRTGIGAALQPKPSKDPSAMMGWIYRSHDVPEWMLAGGAPAASGSASPAGSGSAAAPPPADGSIELKVSSVGNTMAFDVKSFTVSPGQKVHVVFKNNSSMELLPHNWVLVQPGTEATVAAAGLKAGQEAGYLDEKRENVIAFTPLAMKGTTVETTFEAPKAPGSYPFICTVPGHYMMMKGVVVVQ